MVAFQNFKRVVCGSNSNRSTIDKAATQDNTSSVLKDKPTTEPGLGENYHQNVIRSKPTNTTKDNKLEGHDENIGLINNKKMSAVRSHQALATRSANSSESSTNGVPDRQLTRQTGNDHALTRQSKRGVSGDIVASHLPRTRSLNQD